MTRQEFRKLLEAAIRGESKATEDLIILYGPLLDKYSYISGKMDEDLRQHLIVCLLESIHRFKI